MTATGPARQTAVESGAEAATVRTSWRHDRADPRFELDDLDGRSRAALAAVTIAPGATIVLAGAAVLSPPLRTAVLLRDIHELSYQEIAKQLGVAEGTVKSRINRGRAELARLLRRHKVVQS